MKVHLSDTGGVISLDIVEPGQPLLLSASSVDANHVLVTFSQAMMDHPVFGGMLNPANYAIIDPAAMTVLNVFWVERVDSTHFKLTTETQASATYSLSVGNLYGETGTPVVTPNESLFIGTAFDYGEPEQLHYVVGTWPGFDVQQASDDWPIMMAIDHAEMIDQFTIRCYFNAEVDNDTPLNTLGTYLVEARGGSVPVGLTTVTPGPSPVMYVDLVPDREMTAGEYRLTIVSGAIGKGYIRIVEPNNQATFTGLGERPRVIGAVATGAQTVVIQFSEEMDTTLALTDKTSYEIDGGLRVVSVARVNATSVELTVNRAFTPDREYTVTVVG